MSTFRIEREYDFEIKVAGVICRVKAEMLSFYPAFSYPSDFFREGKESVLFSQSCL